MNRHGLVLLVALAAGALGAQAPEWEWGICSVGLETFGRAYSKGLALDPSGNSIMAGNIYKSVAFGAWNLSAYNGNYSDIFVAKADPAGNWLWAVHAGSNNHDYATAVCTDVTGNSYVTGQIYSHYAAWFGSIELSEYGNQAFVAKLDPAGNWLWAKVLDRTSSSGASYGWGIACDAAGNCHVTGLFNGTYAFGATTLTTYGGNDIFAAKLDPAGNWLWANQAGTAISDNVNGICTDGAGNSWITGQFENTATFGAHTVTAVDDKDAYFAKLDASGTWVWAKSLGGTYDDWGWRVSADAGGNSYVIGYLNSTLNFAPTPTSLNGYFAAKMDPDGTWLWATRIETTRDNLRGIKTDSAGNSLIAGSFTSTITVGATTLTADTGSASAFAASLDPGGNWGWAIQAHGAGSTGYHIAGEVDGSCVLAGDFGYDVIFGDDHLVGPYDYSVFLARIATAGIPDPPANLLIGRSDGDTGITLSWSAADGAAVYNVYVSDDPVTGFVYLLSTTDLSVEISWAQIAALGFDPGSVFFYVTTSDSAP
ncbi:MAG: hypothetical protein LHW45_05025 [Candidatus Cloacimonetes bacterium]|nr:hypothetical protein [Candidatus Cloacimonadota bacterium]MDY0366974.1 hypothetical protein [Candidatus Syntrophosphaera sp.]